MTNCILREERSDQLRTLRLSMECHPTRISPEIIGSRPFELGSDRCSYEFRLLWPKGHSCGESRHAGIKYRSDPTRPEFFVARAHVRLAGLSRSTGELLFGLGCFDRRNRLPRSIGVQTDYQTA